MIPISLLAVTTCLRRVQFDLQWRGRITGDIYLCGLTVWFCFVATKYNINPRSVWCSRFYWALSTIFYKPNCNYAVHAI